MLENTLKAKNLYNDYDNVFKEWQIDGVIEQIPEEEKERKGHYILYVLKQNSTTQIRPVFNASARVSQLPSVNVCLKKRPNLVELMTSALLKFRRGDIGVIADIKRAFLQLTIDETEQDFLRFLRFDETGSIIIFQHTQEVFGLSCSPFILNAIINFHLKFI